MKRARQVRLRPLTRLRVRPGDIFVLSVPGFVSQHAAEQIKEQMAKALGGATCLVLANGMTLAAVSGAQAIFERGKE